MNTLIDKNIIEDKIYYIRGQRVMIDSDLAKIYGYTTKTFNQQVQRNIEKFDNDFMFQLNDEELNIISRSQFVTSIQRKGIKGGRVYNPYVFTEQGIYMLMTVLKGELAIKQSKALIRIFKEMKDYIINNNIDNKELLQLSIQVNNNTKDINYIKENMATKKDLTSIMDNFIEKNKYKEFLILNGERIESIIAYKNIYNLAKKSIYIIDNYISIETLYLLKESINIDITIFSDNIGNYLRKRELEEFNYEYPKTNIKLKKLNNIFHDRYIIIDYKLDTEIIYHAGSSSKDGGKRISTIIQIEDNKIYYNLIDKILNNSNLTLK